MPPIRLVILFLNEISRVSLTGDLISISAAPTHGTGACCAEWSTETAHVGSTNTWHELVGKLPEQGQIGPWETRQAAINNSSYSY